MVLKVYERIDDANFDASDEDKATHSFLTLPFDLRQKSRLKAQLDDGTEVGLGL